MIDVFGLASDLIQTVHKDRAAILHSWRGSVQDDAGIATEEYIDIEIMANDQAITAEKLRHIDGINQSQTYRKIYLKTFASTTDIHKGFDIIEFSISEKYKIEQLLEDWTLNQDKTTSWCCVLGVRQK